MEKKEKMMKVSKSVHSKLEKMKSIPEEPFSDVIKRLIEYYEKNKDNK
jgi:predicted CopG family antitoxin